MSSQLPLSRIVSPITVTISIVSAARRASRQGVKGTHCLYVRRWETSIYSRDVMYCSKPTEAQNLVRAGRNVISTSIEAESLVRSGCNELY